MINCWGSAPCKDCKRRHEACHDGCPDYAEFRKKIEERHAKEREAKILEECGRRHSRRRWR